MSSEPNPMERLIRELENVSPEGRDTYIETLVAFSRFAKSCGLAPTWKRLFDLATWLHDLRVGRVAAVLSPAETGRGTVPDSSDKWDDRLLVVVAFAMLLKAQMRQQAAARHIARKYPTLEILMTRGSKLSAAILRWRRDLYDARPGEFLHSFGVKLAEFEDLVNAEKFSKEHCIAAADAQLTKITKKRVSP